MAATMPPLRLIVRQQWTSLARERRLRLLGLLALSNLLYHAATLGWLPLDPLIAIAVAANILVVGGRLVCRSGAGLMDSALPDDLRAAIDAVLARHRADRIDFHDVRTREAGHERFVQLHMLVPGDWSVQRAHDLAETIEDELRAAVDDLTVTLHVEPINDPRAYEDWRLD